MRILFVDRVHPVLWERLSAAGHACKDLSGLDRPRLLGRLAEAEGLVVRSRLMVDTEVLDKAPRLQFIARAGSGMENIDQRACKQRGILLFNSPEGNRDSVAEHAIGMLLALLNHLPKADREVRQGTWDRIGNNGNELKGSTVGIIGYGTMGTAFAQRLQGFGVSVVAHDKYKRGFGSTLVEEVSLQELQQRSDVISLHLPLTPETTHYANAAFFAACAKPFRLINTARGPIVDTAALLDAIEAGKVLGACLDVLEFEQRSLKGLQQEHGDGATWERLRTCDNVLLSPHVAGITTESYFKLADVLADKIQEAVASGRLKG